MRSLAPLFRIFAVIAILAGAGPAGAQEASTAATVERLFRADRIDPGWFTGDFLAAVPAAEVGRMIGDLTRRFGPLEEVEGGGGRLTARLADAEVPIRIALDESGRIAGLRLEGPIVGTIEDQVAAIAALPGRSAVLVETDGRIMAAHEPDAALAVGSAAKLAVLKAVDQAVGAGRLSWTKVVALDPAWRSLPTGILQDWPDTTPLTVATLANLAMSMSDNTATDALIRLVGREAVEAVTPANAPFPTTRELFILKAGGPALRQRWRDGDAAARRAILAEIASAELPAASALPGHPTLGIEWFMPARELCALLRETAHLPALHINPGVAHPQSWLQIAFKGGSETGVLALATRLIDGDGTAHCVVAAWNDETRLDEERLVAPYRAILHLLGREAG